MASNLALIPEEDSDFSILISREYNCLRACEKLTLGETVLLAYVEQLTFHQFPSSRVFLLT